jgi:hypothetical protein
VQDVIRHLHSNGSWRYALYEIYYTPEVTVAVEALQGENRSRTALSQLAA